MEIIETIVKKVIVKRSEIEGIIANQVVATHKKYFPERKISDINTSWGLGNEIIVKIETDITENVDITLRYPHDLYKTEDKDKPGSICDADGTVVLSLCRVCGGAERELPTRCPGRRLTLEELQKIGEGELDF